MAPTSDDSKIVSGKICQPPQAPSMANNLKSPWPIPSLPVSSLNSQKTDHNTIYPATAPHSASCKDTKPPKLLTINPSHNSGSTSTSGSS
ncbi:hypothetical protein D3C85_1419430 [compost metagenome]